MRPFRHGQGRQDHARRAGARAVFQMRGVDEQRLVVELNYVGLRTTHLQGISWGDGNPRLPDDRVLR